MEREILFRGIRKDNAKLIYGYYLPFVVKGVKRHFIISREGVCFDDVLLKDILIEVIPETVGQYTGLKDKNGNKIFEGDILEFETLQKWGFIENGNRVRFVIEFGSFYAIHDTFYEFIGFHTKGNSISFKLNYGCEVIGNIHQNPELIK